jgi:hypothetical protein
MRTVLAVLCLPVALALWGASLWWGLPWSLQLRLEPRPPPPPAQARRIVYAEVIQPFVPPVEGLALGDRVQFDRYGMLAPALGTRHCAVLQPSGGQVEVSPVGGAHHAGRVRLVVQSTAAGCPDPASLE